MAARTGRPPEANPKAMIQDWLTLIDPDGAFLTTSELTAVFPTVRAHGSRPARRAGAPESPTSTPRDSAAEPAYASGYRPSSSTGRNSSPRHSDRQRQPSAADQWSDTSADQRLCLTLRSTKVRLGVFVWQSGTPLAAVSRQCQRDPCRPPIQGRDMCASPARRLPSSDDDLVSLVWAPRGGPALLAVDVGDLRRKRSFKPVVSLLVRAVSSPFLMTRTGETLSGCSERAADAEAEHTKGPRDVGSSVRRATRRRRSPRNELRHNRRVLADVPGTEVYEAAVTVLMRLVFLLFAEERRLLPAEDPLWAESYSILSLRDELRQTATRDGHDALERRATAWYRLLATFRAVHGGVNHDRLTLPAYGGSLFDPDRFAFLEGRRIADHIVVGGVDLGRAPGAEPGPGRPVAIDDRTVLAILDSLLTVQVKSGRTKVAQRVSYKALDVEQIGHCYEGLLDHGAIPIDELSVGLVGPEGGEPELPIRQLEDFEDHDGLCEWLSDKTRCNRKPAALAKLLDQQPEGVDLARLRVACGHNDGVVDRVLPYWGIIRQDLRDLPIVLLPGSMFVTQTSTRRNTGAQYTTKSLAEEVVQYALEPLVYDPGPQNEPDRENWKLKHPAAILICESATRHRSGAILTSRRPLPRRPARRIGA